MVDDAQRGDERVATVRIVTATCPDRATAERLADELVGAGLAACAQVGGPITSVYRWQGEVQHDEEWVLTAKSTASSAPGAVASIVASHPYDVPEVLVTEVVDGHGPYLAWVVEEAGGSPG